jgi:N-acetylglutamate synthase-like GNAT family acetyltransferase
MCGVIRRAAAQDIDEILALIGANTDRLVPRERDELRQLIDTFWVAEEDGAIVGCCCLEVYSPKIAELRSLAVRESHRRRGIGAQLTAAAVEEANRRGIPQVLVVTSNRDFFERLNFGSCLNEKYALFWNAPETAGD